MAGGNFPTYIFETYALASAPTLAEALGTRSKFIIIKANEQQGGVLTMHFWDGEELHSVGSPVNIDPNVFARLANDNVFEGFNQFRSKLVASGSSGAIDIVAEDPISGAFFQIFNMDLSTYFYFASFPNNESASSPGTNFMELYAAIDNLLQFATEGAIAGRIQANYEDAILLFNDTGASIKRKNVTYPANQAAQVQDPGKWVYLDGSGANVTYTIDPADFEGQEFRIRRIDNSANTVSVAQSAGNIELKIGDQASVQLNYRDTIRLYSDGTKLIEV